MIYEMREKSMIFYDTRAKKWLRLATLRMSFARYSDVFWLILAKSW